MDAAVLGLAIQKAFTTTRAEGTRGEKIQRVSVVRKLPKRSSDTL